MKTESYLRYLLSDTQSLNTYYKEHKAVSLRDIQRAILLKVRSRQYSVPDHYYRLGTEYSFGTIKKLSEIFTIGLTNLADEYLESHNGRIYVKGHKFNDWQLLLPLIPPLLLVTLKIWSQHGPLTGSITDFAYKHLIPSLKFTAIPSAYIPEMEVFRHENNGLDDLHLHLNGATETDLAWHNLLKYPEITYREICQAYKNDKVREQLEQLTDITNPIDFLHIFRIAGNLRQKLFDTTNTNIVPCGDNMTFNDWLLKVASQNEYNNQHPYRHIFGENASPLILESVLYIKVLDYLVQYPNDDTVAGTFHYYLLILGLCNKLLVQQTDSFGFEQFQKYTLNNLREHSEKSYTQRFLQLAGNDLLNTGHIEGRFSPKSTLHENISIIQKILTGFESFNHYQTRYTDHNTTLSLTAHFIKKSDNKKSVPRFKQLRKDLDNRTDALLALKNTQSHYARTVKGIDAAASEFDTPPEVFAPSFHKLRQHGISHATFHAGEDFFHIISGLRAIYEAIDFLEMQTGDRIGHATASGVDVNLWRENIGDTIWMKKQDYMDDLVFSYYMITKYQEKDLEHLLPIIALKVEEYSCQIYDHSPSIHTLIEAWRMRKHDPSSLISNNHSHKSEALTIYTQYHSQVVQEKGNEIIQIGAYDIFTDKELTCLQHLILKVMHQRQIIIETLPTSNVIIGQHHSFHTYHLYNWYKWSKEGVKIPAIVVGTDDAGIFATNIYNEYCHIYCMLVFDKGLSPTDSMAYIRQLAHNAKVYAFK